MISFKRSLYWIGGALIINFLFEYCYDFILGFFKVHKDPQVIVGIIPDASSGLFSILFFVFAIAIIIPVLEEIIFRVILYQGLKSKLPVSVAIIITSLVFAFIHVQLITLLPIFVMGFLLTYSYEKTQSLLIPVTIHCINNFLGVCLILASR